jgi:hypothetical protein
MNTGIQMSFGNRLNWQGRSWVKSVRYFGTPRREQCLDEASEGFAENMREAVHGQILCFVASGFTPLPVCQCNIFNIKLVIPGGRSSAGGAPVGLVALALANECHLAQPFRGGQMLEG